MFTSFIIPGNPNEELHIQRLKLQTTSVLGTGTPSLPTWIPCSALGQFFQAQEAQSTAPTQPGNPDSANFSSTVFRSYFVRDRKISEPKQRTTQSEKRDKLSEAVVSKILQYSPVLSAAVPSASCRRADTAFCSPDAPSLPTASLRQVK
jgi:hypothetical protein